MTGFIGFTNWFLSLPVALSGKRKGKESVDYFRLTFILSSKKTCKRTFCSHCCFSFIEFYRYYFFRSFPCTYLCVSVPVCCVVISLLLQKNKQKNVTHKKHFETLLVTRNLVLIT